MAKNSRNKAKKKAKAKTSRKLSPGQKAWRTRCRNAGGVAAARAQAKAAAHGRKKTSRSGGHGGGKKHKRKTMVSHCLTCRQKVGGGAWGMAQHMRKHGAHAPTSRYTPNQQSYLQQLRDRLAGHKAKSATEAEYAKLFDDAEREAAAKAAIAENMRRSMSYR